MTVLIAHLARALLLACLLAAPLAHAQKPYATPDAAAEALVKAMRANDALAMQAVLDGVGLAIAQLAYVSDALTAGRLVAPFPITASKREAWFLEYRPVRREDPALVAFRDCLHHEADRERQVETALVNRGSTGATRAPTSLRKG